MKLPKDREQIEKKIKMPHQNFANYKKKVVFSEASYGIYLSSVFQVL